MIVKIVDNILHIVYNTKDKQSELYKKVLSVADKFEGKLRNRLGANFPANDYVQEQFRGYLQRQQPYSYVIMYPSNDRCTMDHELCHAKFFLDENYKARVHLLWESLSQGSKDFITQMLTRMGYPKHVLVDEFQAYYFTEKPNFFGKIE